jgi:hypothetical protein
MTFTLRRRGDAYRSGRRGYSLALLCITVTCQADLTVLNETNVACLIGDSAQLNAPTGTFLIDLLIHRDLETI